ncbi:MAG: tRNA pseudouridine(54/55) synthase Pus10 [Planctomycetota bacterium]|jgi:tRNA pseudouridine synthase 10
MSSDAEPRPAPEGGAKPGATVPTTAPVRVLFEGRYRKLVRDLPQTVFYCPKCKGRGCDACEGFGKLTRDSVQELIARVAMPRFKARRNKFHGAGREDLDVRMLGSGRPFVFEMLKARRPGIDLAEVEEEINRRWEGRIEVHGLKLCGRDRVVEVKETRCPKDYRARIAFDEPLDEAGRGEVAAVLDRLIGEGPLTLLQQTPQRVAHRRKDMERERWVRLLAHEPCDEGWSVSLRSEHGTYIKEAISSDGERTKPSLSSLLGRACRCVELDVLGILPAETPADSPLPPGGEPGPAA